MNSPDYLIYLGVCPICDGGLCRVRTCGVAKKKLYPLAVCDECEAMWTEPDLRCSHFVSTPSEARSPVDGEPIWQEPNRWATVEDVYFFGWYEYVYIDRPTDLANPSATENL